MDLRADSMRRLSGPRPDLSIDGRRGHSQAGWLDLRPMDQLRVAADTLACATMLRSDSPIVTFEASDDEPVRQALRGWQQRVQAVIEIGRDSDDLPARLPVLHALAHELVADLQRAAEGLDSAAPGAGAALPNHADELRAAIGRAHRLLHGIELWHRPQSVGALRKARDGFRAAADRIDARR